MPKYRGHLTMSYEALKELIGLEKDTEILFVGPTGNDIVRECFSIMVKTDENNSDAIECSEACRAVSIKRIELTDVQEVL